ncbi:hypothetical protein SBA4_3580007 [Candidatus Sulfopaludibacter sp. SbA4]|nr:hypothetical protein SBA4_3580007 [Candidatus Sulfopaludibacter sp. SbA4]
MKRRQIDPVGAYATVQRVLILPRPEHGHQVMLRKLLFPNPPPYLEYLIRKVEGADHVGMEPNLGDVVVRLVPILLQLGEFSDQTLDFDLNGRRIVLIASLEYRAAHSAVLEHPAEPRTLFGYTPVGDEVRYQKVERRVVRRGYGTLETRLLGVFSAAFRKVLRIPKQVVGIRHLLRPCLFPRRRLFGFTSEVVVWKHAKGVEVQMLTETLNHIVRHLTQAILCGIVRQNDPEEYGPLAAPVFAHAVPDTHNVGSKRSLDLPHFRPDSLLLGHGYGHQHTRLPIIRITHGTLSLLRRGGALQPWLNYYWRAVPRSTKGLRVRQRASCDGVVAPTCRSRVNGQSKERTAYTPAGILIV